MEANTKSLFQSTRRRKVVKPVNTDNINLFDDYEKIKNLHAILPTVKEEFVKVGITKAQLTCLKKVLDVDYFTLSNMLAITERTIHMKKEGETFSHIISDRIMAIAELYGYGYRIFNLQERFNTWMKFPNRYFQGRSPIELMDTQVGTKLVRDEINRFEVGTF